MPEAGKIPPRHSAWVVVKNPVLTTACDHTGSRVPEQPCPVSQEDRGTCLETLGLDCNLYNGPTAKACQAKGSVPAIREPSST